MFLFLESCIGMVLKVTEAFIYLLMMIKFVFLLIEIIYQLWVHALFLL